jgi:DNA-binding transcriptional regulator YdaS (Cro superfamily)
MNMLKHWMRKASTEEQEELALMVGTSRPYLYQLAGGFRQASPVMGAQIETETERMAKRNPDLPVLYRTDLVDACRACRFAQQCLGPIARRSDFDLVEEGA